MKKEGLKLGLGIVFLIIMLMFSASALTASISNPRMVLYKNITEREILEFENSVIVNNVNNYSIGIKIEPKGVWKARVDIPEKEFSLASGDRREVLYTIQIDEAGYYEGDILVIFNSNEEKSYLSLAQDLVVIVADENGKVPGEIDESSDNNSSFGRGLIIGLVSVIILMVILILLITNKGRRK